MNKTMLDLKTAGSISVKDERAAQSSVKMPQIAMRNADRSSLKKKIVREKTPQVTHQGGFVLLGTQHVSQKRAQRRSPGKDSRFAERVRNIQLNQASMASGAGVPTIEASPLVSARTHGSGEGEPSAGKQTGSVNFGSAE